MVHQKPKDIRAIFTIAMWELWKHRNAVVFDGVPPSLEVVALKIVNEGQVWHQAGLIKGSLEHSFITLARWATSE